MINFSYSCVSLSISIQARPSPLQRQRPELFSHHELTTKLSKRNWKDSKRKGTCKAHSWALLITVIPSSYISLPEAKPWSKSLQTSFLPNVLEKKEKKNNLLTWQAKISGGEFISVKNINWADQFGGKIDNTLLAPSETFKRSDQMRREEKSMPQANV